MTWYEIPRGVQWIFVDMEDLGSRIAEQMLDVEPKRYAGGVYIAAVTFRESMENGYEVFQATGLTRNGPLANRPVEVPRGKRYFMLEGCKLNKRSVNELGVEWMLE